MVESFAIVSRLAARGAGAALVVFLLSSCATHQLAAAQLSPHRAFYSIRLGTANQGSSVVAARGSMSMTFERSCEGWVMRQQMSMAMETSDGKVIDQDTRYGGLESFDGLTYRFGSFSKADDDALNYRGTANLPKPGAPGLARYIDPESKSVPLPAGTLFPTSHTIQLIEAAKAGTRYIVRPLFDGTEGKGAEEVSTFIGPRREAGTFKGPVQSQLLNHPGWYVRMAIFESEKQDPEPEYEMGFLQLENGVSPYLEINYSDFTLIFDLQKIEDLPQPRC